MTRGVNMTLNQWVDTYGVHPIAPYLSTERHGSVAIPYDTTIWGGMAWELWHLSDYVVTSVTGGVIWLSQFERSE